MGKAKQEEDHVTEDQTEQGFAEPAAEYEAAEPETLDAVADELETLRAERDMLRDRFMRALADAENSRKRSERDRREAEQYGGSKLARDMLPVFDALRRALETMQDKATEADKAVLEGIELTMREITNVFRKHGIEPIEPAPGDAFDPQLHQAMFEAPVPGTKAGDILQVMAVGFMIHDRLLRPAQVGVSSMPRS
jgi:molecular chaperone GrpE